MVGQLASDAGWLTCGGNGWVVHVMPWCPSCRPQCGLGTKRDQRPGSQYKQPRAGTREPGAAMVWVKLKAHAIGGPCWVGPDVEGPKKKKRHTGQFNQL
jgi:hypothetical protein